MSIKKLSASIALGLGLIGASSAFAASTVDLSVIGTIVPTSCVPTLGATTVSLGNISTSDLDPINETPLTPKTVTFRIECLAPAKFAVRGVDNEASSVLVNANENYGLGMSGTQKIGYYQLRFQGPSLQGDSSPVIGLTSTDLMSWAAAPVSGPSGGDGPLISHGTNYLGFGDGGTTAVKDIEQMQGTLEVRAFIAPTSGLTVTTDTPINGNATLEVIYL